MNIREIIKEYLLKNGFGGLFNNEDCGCDIDDLFPCDNCPDECVPAYKVRCSPDACNNKECEGQGYDEEFCYTTEKPKEVKEK